MEFIEQPLSYEKARRVVLTLERTHKVSSGELFSGEREPASLIDRDVLFEWRSYYEFVCEVEERLRKSARQ